MIIGIFKNNLCLGGIFFKCTNKDPSTRTKNGKAGIRYRGPHAIPPLHAYGSNPKDKVPMSSHVATKTYAHRKNNPLLNLYMYLNAKGSNIAIGKKKINPAPGLAINPTKPCHPSCTVMDSK